jgi:hypothetical protein
MSDEKDRDFTGFERQMGEHELELFGRLVASAAAQLPADATEDEIHTAVIDLLRNDPETRDLADRLAILQRHRGQP